jgi:hypothetical protein
MLTIERVLREVSKLPGLVKIGTIALLLSGFDDISLHLAGGGLLEPISRPHAFSPDEAAAHLVAFVSMVLILTGVVLDGVRRTRARRASTRRPPEGVA